MEGVTDLAEMNQLKGRITQLKTIQWMPHVIDQKLEEFQRKQELEMLAQERAQINSRRLR